MKGDEAVTVTVRAGHRGDLCVSVFDTKKNRGGGSLPVTHSKAAVLTREQSVRERERNCAQEKEQTSGGTVRWYRFFQVFLCCS